MVRGSSKRTAYIDGTAAIERDRYATPVVPFSVANVRDMEDEERDPPTTVSRIRHVSSA